MKEDCAIIVAFHWDKGGSNNIFAAQIEYYKRRNWRVVLVFVNEFRGRASLSPSYISKSELKADYISDIYTPMFTRYSRFIVSTRILKNDRSGPVHRYFMNKFGQLDNGALTYLSGKRVREICVNWFENINCALNIRQQIDASDASIVVHTHDVMSHHKHVSRGRNVDISALEEGELAKADRLVHVSDSDADHFSQRVRKPHLTSYITLHPDTEARIKQLKFQPRPRTLLYVGSWNYANPSGVEFFFRQIVPFLRKDITIFVAGSICRFLNVNLRAETQGPNVRLLYRVEDVLELYENVQAVVLPAIDGSGASVKLVEALAMGVPFIASPAALRGIPEEVRTALLPFTASRPVEFADKIEMLLSGGGKDFDFQALYWNYFANEAWWRRLDGAGS